MSVYLQNGKVLLVGGSVATDAACCCFSCAAPPDTYSLDGSALSYVCDGCESCTSTSGDGGLSRFNAIIFLGGFNANGCGDTGYTPVQVTIQCVHNFLGLEDGWYASIFVSTRAPVTFCGCQYSTTGVIDGTFVRFADLGSPVGIYPITLSPTIGGGSGSASVTMIIS